MKNEFASDDNKVQMEKAKKNLVYVGIFSIIMLFAGLTSAYIVSMGDTFWLKIPLPSYFWVSTVIIAISSFMMQLSVFYAKKGNQSALKATISVTLILGLAFIYTQFKGYSQLVDNGVHATGNYIIVTDGKYGDYYEVKYKGDFIEINGNDYLIKGALMTDNQVKEYQNFMSQFLTVDEVKPFSVKQYGKDFELYFHSTPLSLKDGHLITENGDQLQYLDRVRLTQLATNVRDLRGDFFVRGEMGKDFQIYYKGKELKYKDRQLQLNGQNLSSYLQIKSMEAADTASSYLYLITFLHLLHVLATVFFLLKLVIHSFTGKINAENNISVRAGAIFWHFLGLLWLYLLLFLLFIH